MLCRMITPNAATSAIIVATATLAPGAANPFEAAGMGRLAGRGSARAEATDPGPPRERALIVALRRLLLGHFKQIVSRSRILWDSTVWVRAVFLQHLANRFECGAAGKGGLP
jgi:hypothetical protein